MVISFNYFSAFKQYLPKYSTALSKGPENQHFDSTDVNRYPIKNLAASISVHRYTLRSNIDLHLRALICLRGWKRWMGRSSHML